MAETMGTIIRRLRRERGLTQEQLAECIGVTAQAVSKWENDLGMPDISQVVPLSGALGVRTDVLFGLEAEGADAAVQQAATLETEEKLDAEKSVELWKDLLRRYPRNGAVRFRLAGAYLKQENDEKAVEQFVRILEDSTDEELRMKALDMLCFSYRRLGDYENAVHVAKLCPPIHISREALLAKIDGYEKHNEVNKELLSYCLREICWCVRRIDYPNENARQTALRAARQTLDLFQGVAEDEKLNGMYEELQNE